MFITTVCVIFLYQIYFQTYFSCYTIGIIIKE